MLKLYIQKILGVARRGDATEESYYSTLKDLLMEFAKSTSKKDIHITILPKKTEAGNPDFRVWDGKQKIVGYIEAKTPETELDQIEKTDQIKRYKSTFKNFMLTNFFEFRLYKDGLHIGRTKIADPMSIYTLRGTPPVENKEDFESLLEKFFSFSFPSISSAETLAVELAKRTRFLRDEVIAEELREEEKNGIGKIHGFYEAFHTYLIRGLTKEQFADLYSQTITYGLFASRTRCEGEFNRKIAVYDIPHTIGILREIFDFISLGDLPPQLEWIVDEISNVLANVDVKKIFSEFFRNRKGEDPVFHFYETFLAKYDPEEREKRGVFYTPESVVSYIVRSLHTVLKEKFDLENGLANEKVTILDPAAGTLTFLAEAIKEATKEIVSKFGEGIRKKFIEEHVLKNFYAFELMVAPYAIGHLKISFLLNELGYTLQENERVKFYLTNTLELEEIEQTALPGMASLAEESRKAGEVKKRTPIWVILGNPPYSGSSANKGKWITGLIEDYKYVDGKPLGERNPKWLQDDYVKFIRFAQWKINQVEEGVIGYITNHSYLDNPTFRGMRRHLMKSFDEIYVLDLHGNSSKKEKCPDGSKDENVFYIRQGVAISLYIKKKKRKDVARVYHADLWGLRQDKYNWLLENDIKTTKWERLKPHSEEYLFIPRDEESARIYAKFIKVTDVFPLYSVGVQTHRDKLVIDIDKDSLKKRIQMFRNTSISDELIRNSIGLKDTETWKLKEKRQKIKADHDWEKRIIPIFFRPFDIRWIFCHDDVVDRARRRVMSHMMQENLGFNGMRQYAYEVNNYNYALVSSGVTDSRIFISNKGAAYLFPLYLYPNINSKKPNLNPRLLRSLEKTYGKKPEPVEVFYYVYGVLFSNIYRNKYAEFLKTNFPRVPFPKDYELFKNISKMGSRLVELHLLKSERLGTPIAKFQGKGSSVVKGTPVYKRNRVYINEKQYFEGVKREIWDYQIGGYEVLSKWLKERIGNCLLRI
ncbi:MAG: N-6 DNA methylase [Candidatus Bathyarchaeota archaeon]|nr:N-6 DNA methylase [Candidatus Bathyarchaeota archaeon]